MAFRFSGDDAFPLVFPLLSAPLRPISAKYADTGSTGPVGSGSYPGSVISPSSVANRTIAARSGEVGNDLLGRRMQGG